MKIDKISQKGFGSVEVLIVVVVIALIGGAGWYVLHSKDSKTKTATTAVTTKTKTTPATDTTKTTTPAVTTAYLTLDSYKVRIPLNDATSKLKLGTVGEGGYGGGDKSVAIIAPELDSVWRCAVDPGDTFKASIGIISITSAAKRAGPYEPAATKKIGTYTYGFEPAGGDCTNIPGYQTLVDAFKVQFEQIQAY